MRGLLLAGSLLVIGLKGYAQPVPIAEAHAHNDYWHFRPLLQALDNGFMSVEADVHLLKGDLLVAHEAFFTRKGRSLEKLYLRPLYERAKANDFRSIYADGPQEFTLYIDIKQGCPHICDTLIAQLQRYADMLTVWEHGKKRPGAVHVIMGACGREHEWLNAEKRWFSFDAGFGAVGGVFDSTAIARVSTSLRSYCQWRGHGSMAPEELEQLRKAIAAAHAEGREVRFWAATNRPKVWELLLNEGADLINVDRLRRFRRFMERRTRAETSPQGR